MSGLDGTQGRRVRSGGRAAGTLAERLAAALGTDLRGRKVVISVDPGQFITPGPDPAQYAGNFSYLAAAELVWSPDLSQQFKSRVAQRMLQFPDTLRPHPLLFFAARCL